VKPEVTMKRYVMLWSVMAAIVIAAPCAHAQQQRPTRPTPARPQSPAQQQPPAVQEPAQQPPSDDDEGSEPPAGSLTLLSRPSNASYKLVGEQTFVGRTPGTLQRGLAGRFEVRGFGPGYETWKKDVTLDGVTSDTVWMALKRKSALLGAARSAVLPGWGQFYCERPGSGWTFAISEGVAGIVSLVAWRSEQRRTDDLSAAESRNRIFNNASSRQALAAAQGSLEEAQQFKTQALRAMVGIAALSVLEALILGPPRPADGAAIELKDPSPDIRGAQPSSVSLVKVKVRF
jgi:hypothetical protein